jgi:bifunctional non-homologous end joining protein LigD
MAMGLTEYKRKRNFKKTPEPTGARAKSAPGRQFVVQKHAASRLHYDFRLEQNGTLKSWAIPKGPNVDPSVKALAVQVEDHPLEYATFEGVIPQGEYGGGTVMVWDHGTWEPEEDPDQGFKKGRLKFTLHGVKLKGSWALVRMGGRAGDDGKNWLLIKHRDKYARPDAKTDLLKRKPRSVISNRDMEEIAADSDRVWSSDGKAAQPSRANTAKRKAKRLAPAKKKTGQKPLSLTELAGVPGAKRAPLPRDFKPQLATLASGVPPGDNWLHELKFDGYRIVAFLNKRAVRLVTRNENDWTARFRPVADALAELPIESAILDGEVVSLDERGMSNFQKLQNSLKSGDKDSLVFYMFDVPYLEGYDLTQTPLLERKEILARLLLSANPNNDGTLRYSDHIQGQGASVLQHACRNAMEGVVCKRADSTYQQSRSTSWLKVKCLQQQEFVIAGYTRPEGSRVGFGALLLGYYNKDGLHYAGRVGTGFTTQSLRQIAKEVKSREIDKSPFVDRLASGEKRGAVWIRPELVGEVEFTEWTSDGRLRHPSFQGLREDKPAKDIIREKPEPTASVGSGHDGRAKKSGSIVQKESTTMAMKTKKSRSPRRTNSSNGKTRLRAGSKSDDVVIAGVRLSNPGRVLYPEDGITKRDLAEYYERIADWVLPYVVNRPLTLVRCPEGHTGECFYQKHLTGSMPGAVGGVNVAEKGKPEEYVMIKDLPGLISLVQMGVLEMHPWPARADNVERPDFLVFDLDPSEEVPWKAIIAGAQELRERLEDAGLTTYLRTSGGKGLHIVVPIARRNTWDEVKAFAKSVADKMTSDAPDRYIATMSKAKRRGKIFIDYLRNQRAATAIASYSTRARAGAPVAVPIAWDELSARTRPNMFNIKNTPKRLEKLTRDPWEGFFSSRQSLTRAVQDAFK